MLIFISIPMNGLTESQIKERFEKIKERVGLSFDYIDSCIEQNCPLEGEKAGVWYLGRSIELLAEADLVVFDKNYKKARGCLIEEMVCKKYHIPRKYLED